MLQHHCMDRLDSLAEVISESIPDQNEINSLLEEFTGNPLDLNSASRAELEYFSFLYTGADRYNTRIPALSSIKVHWPAF